MSAFFISTKISSSMVQISVLLLALLVIGHWTAPAGDELQEVYFETCQASCSVVKHEEEAHDCREKFCPNYTNYLLTGFTLPDSTPSLVSSQRKEAADFCATWMIYLVQEFGWQKRNRLNLKDCACAAGKDCIV